MLERWIGSGGGVGGGLAEWGVGGCVAASARRDGALGDPVVLGGQVGAAGTQGVRRAPPARHPGGGGWRAANGAGCLVEDWPSLAGVSATRRLGVVGRGGGRSCRLSGVGVKAENDGRQLLLEAASSSDSDLERMRTLEGRWEVSGAVTHLGRVASNFHSRRCWTPSTPTLSLFRRPAAGGCGGPLESVRDVREVAGCAGPG
jgi:hypothetical protein